MTSNLARERGLDLDADKVMGVFETTLVVEISARSPVLADYRDQRVTLPHALRENIDEIEAWSDIVNVKEDALVSELLRQPIVDQPCEAGRVFPPVADEDAAQHVDALAA